MSVISKLISLGAAGASGGDSYWIAFDGLRNSSPTLSQKYIKALAVDGDDNIYVGGEYTTGGTSQQVFKFDNEGSRITGGGWSVPSGYTGSALCNIKYSPLNHKIAAGMQTMRGSSWSPWDYTQGAFITAMSANNLSTFTTYRFTGKEDYDGSIGFFHRDGVANAAVMHPTIANLNYGLVMSNSVMYITCTNLSYLFGGSPVQLSTQGMPLGGLAISNDGSKVYAVYTSYGSYGGSGNRYGFCISAISTTSATHVARYAMYPPSGTNNNGTMSVGDVKVDANGNVYTLFMSNNFPSGSSQVFVMKFNSSLSLQWRKRIVISNLHSLTADRYQPGIAVDGSGNVYVAHVDGSADCLTKLDSNGNLEWCLKTTTSTNGYTNVEVNSKGTPIWALRENIAKIPPDGSLSGSYACGGGRTFTFSDNTSNISVDTSTNTFLAIATLSSINGLITPISWSAENTRAGQIRTGSVTGSISENLVTLP